MNLSSLSTTFAHVPTDWIILLVVAILITIDAMRSGASRAIALSTALPIAYVFSILLPKAAFLDSIVKQSGTTLSAIIILIALAILTVCTYRISRDYSPASAPKAVMAGVASTIILAVFWIQISALSSLWHFSSQAVGIFGSVYALYWLLAAYLILAAVRR